MTTFDVATIAADLTDDGDSHVVEDSDGSTWTFTLHVESDDMSILDQQGEGVWCGRLEYGSTHPYTSQRIRPEGFDGNAERIDRYNPGVAQGDYVGLWWQPPSDVPRTSEHFDSLRRQILDLLTYGYYYAYLTLDHQRADGYARNWRTAGIGGLDSVYDEIVSDQLAELIAELSDIYAK